MLYSMKYTLGTRICMYEWATFCTVTHYSYVTQYTSSCYESDYKSDLKNWKNRETIFYLRLKYVHNSIVVTRLLVKISSYTLLILVLLEIFNIPEDYRTVLKKYPFLKDGKSK